MRATRRRAGSASGRPWTVGAHNLALRAGAGDVAGLEDALTEALIPVIEEAADEAARNFERLALDHASLTAAGLRQTFSGAGVKPSSTMIAVRPRPDEAAALAHDGGEPADELHVTLAYLGETEGSLEPLAGRLRLLAAEHAPLEGNVGGHGRFGDNGKGNPGIYMPSVPGLLELRHAVTAALAEAGVDYARAYGWIPHLTVMYDETGNVLPGYDGVGAPLHFDDLLLVRGGETAATIPLSGARPVTASGTRSVTASGITRSLAWQAEHPGEHLPPPPHIRRLMELASSEIADRIAAVAEEHRPDGGYGETAWNEETGTVLWIPADWTTDEETAAAEAAFLALDGVESVEVAEAEASLAPYADSDDWEIVWTSSAQKGVTAAGAELPGYCLAAELRGKTDPVRIEAVKNAMTPALKRAGLSFDVTNPFAAKALARSASHVVGISQTTQLDVMKVVGRAYEEGLTIPQTAKAIRAAIKGSSASRARMIARTELAAAASGGSLAATQIVADATGTTLYKTWLTAPGAIFPRHEDYEGLDGQTVGLDEAFDVGGETVMYPGDPDGVPEETINCRCTLVYTDDPSELTASSPPSPLSPPHDADEARADELDRIYRSMTAAATATWTPPAPDEILRADCEVPGAHAAPPMRAANDTISVGQAPFVAAATRERIQRLELDVWPPRPDAASRHVLGTAKDTVELYTRGVEAVAPVEPIALPSTAAAAADLFMQGVARTEALAGKTPDPARLAEGAKNWKKLLARDASFAPDDLAAVRAADEYNRGGAVYKATVERYGQDAAVVIKDTTPPDSLLSPGRDLAAAKRLTSNRVTVLRQEALTEKRLGPIAPGDAGSISNGGLEAVLRHEYGHQIEEALTPAERAEFRQALPSPEVVKADLTRYGASNLAEGNAQEAFCELFAVVSDPAYDPAAWAPWIRDLGERYFPAAAEAAPRDVMTWDADRAFLHDQIIAAHFVDKTLPAEGDRTAYLTAGGGASGKSSAVFGTREGETTLAQLETRKDTIYIDPDRIKKMLPEFKEIAREGSGYAATAVHEESSQLAKDVVRVAIERGYSVVLDTTGSSSGFAAKIAQFKTAGYDTRVSMVSIRTNEAIARSVARGDRSGRYVQITPLKDAHRGASAQLAGWSESDLVDGWRLYDNSTGLELVAEGGRGKIEVHDEARWQEILAKATE